MLPTTQVYRPKPLRPISQNDSAASTGLASNPNGTYVANPYPTTAAAGMQGGYGSMLPTTQSSNPLFTVKPLLPKPPHSPLYNAIVSGALTSPAGATFQPQGSGRSGRETLNSTQNRTGQHISPGWTGSGTFTQNAAMQGVLNRLDMGDMSAVSQIPKADLEAMGLGDLVAATGGSDNAGEPTDFQKTKTYKNNQEKNIPLERQLRWDAKRKKYITVGQWMREERRKYNKKGKYVGDKRSNQSAAKQQQAQAAPKPEEEKEYTGSIQQMGVVNFNTATG